MLPDMAQFAAILALRDALVDLEARILKTFQIFSGIGRPTLSMDGTLGLIAELKGKEELLTDLARGRNECVLLFYVFLLPRC
jgi:hypothetical protein